VNSLVLAADLNIVSGKEKFGMFWPACFTFWGWNRGPNSGFYVPQPPAIPIAPLQLLSTAVTLRFAVSDVAPLSIGRSRYPPLCQLPERFPDFPRGLSSLLRRRPRIWDDESMVPGRHAQLVLAPAWLRRADASGVL